jgi:ComF family protein
MSVFDSLIGVLAPHDCLVCGREGGLLCGYCRPEALAALPPRCYRCQARTDDFATCRRCRRVSRLAGVWVCARYEGLAKQLVYRLKFERARVAADVIAGLMRESLPHLPAGTVVTYLPTATSRRRRRGYDQAELIARSLARQMDLPFQPLLARRGQSRQTGVGRRQRTTQPCQIFWLPRPIDSGATTLVVDDVLTTGATLEAAATELRRAGAKKVYAAIFAQKF